jgi:3-phytase
MNRSRFLARQPRAVLISVIVAVAVAVAAPAQSGPALLHDHVLEATSLQVFGYSAAELAVAQTFGLAFTDQPAIGSGLQRLQGSQYLAVTDRGPSLVVGGLRIFPLPQFAPSIVTLRASANRLSVQSVVRLVDANGAGVTGIPNSATEDSVPFLDAATQLPFDHGGVDVEDVHALPGSRYLLCDEYSPSLLVADVGGTVLRRFTPAGVTLPGAQYPIAATLPGVLAQRRANRGFESLAVADDGLTAYTLTQSPLGSTASGSPYRDSRIVRVLRLDVADPMNVAVTGQFAVALSPIADYPAGSAQRDLKVSAAAWVSPDVVLLLELIDTAGIAGMRLLLADLRAATNVHGLPVAATLDLEDTGKGPAFFGFAAATTAVVYEQFDTDVTRLLPSGKLEGLSILNQNQVAISTDNDFGLGEVPGAPSRLLVLRLADPLPLAP